MQDAISDTGGSAAYGGPVDADGRLLIRERIMLSLGCRAGRKLSKYHGSMDWFRGKFTGKPHL